MTRAKHTLVCFLIAILFGLVLGVKSSYASFSTSDLEGTWQLHILTTQGVWVRETANVDSSGNVSYIAEFSEGGSEEGTDKIIISNNGIMTSTGSPNLQGVMSTDKNFFVMTFTVDFEDFEFALILGVKQGSGPYNTSELVGTWQGHNLVSGSWNGWERDTITFDGAGYSTVQVVDSEGNSETQDRPNADISDNGIITASEWEPLKGVINIAKNLIVITNTKSEGICELGIIMKEGGSFSSQDLTGTWYAHTLTVGSWKSWTRLTWNMDGAGNFQYESEDMFGNPGTFGGTLDISNTGIITFEGNPTLHGVMNIDKNIIAWTEGWGFGKYGLTVLVKSEKTSISGSISHEGTPLCTMVLANGEYMFTCDDSLGLYDLDVPLDQNGEITLFGFCSGLSPYMTILTPDQALGFDIAMTHAAAGSREVEVTVQTEPGVTNPEYFRVSGTATYGEEDLCTMVLINGQNMFSCDANLGTFDLEVPLDSNGEITLYVFCSGFAPYKDVFAP